MISSGNHGQEEKASQDLTAECERDATYASSQLIMQDDLALEQQSTRTIPAILISSETSELKFWNSEANNYVSHLLNLARNSGIYAIASLASPFVNLLLAPFLTRFLPRSDYGALVILTTAITLLSGIAQFGLSSAFFRAYTYDYNSKNDKLAVLSTTVILLLFSSALIATLIIIAAPWLALFLLNDTSFSESVKLSAFVILLQNLTVPGLSWLRAENRPTLFSFLSILNLLVTALVTIILVGVLHRGIAGALIAAAGGYAVIAFCTLPVIFQRVGFHLRCDISRVLFVFGFPHVINLLSGWVLQFSDRYLLGHFGSLSQTASYGIAYSLGNILSTTIITPFSLAWWSLIYTIAQKENAVHIFQLIFRWFSIILLFATFGLSIFGVAVLDLFFPSTYHSVGAIIPVIAMSIMFNGIFLIISLGISIQRKTWYSAILITCSALANFGLNIALIPLYGAMGAAVSTLIAYFMLAVTTYFVNQRIYPISFEIGRFGVALLVGIGLYMGSNSLAKLEAIHIAWGTRIIALILYGGCLLLLGKQPIRKC